MARNNIHQVEIIRTGLDHPECVNFGPDGRLYAGGFAGQVYVLDPPEFALRQLASTQGFIGGVTVDGKHNIYLCNQTKRHVVRITQSGESTVFCDKAPDGPLLQPNYGLFDAKGNYYFSDSGETWKPNGRFIRVLTDGRSESLIGGNWHFPNGLALSPKDRSIYMIETVSSDVIRIPVNSDGTVGTPEIYALLPGNMLDGLAFAKSGNLYVSCYFPNRIFVISPDRNIELLIEDNVGEILNQPTNLAFEPKGTRLFFANLGGQHIGALDVGEQGMPLYYPQL